MEPSAPVNPCLVSTDRLLTRSAPQLLIVAPPDETMLDRAIAEQATDEGAVADERAAIAK